MPMPTPLPGEDQAAFLRRCMADPAMLAEFPGQDQRVAVCLRQWQRQPATLAARAVPALELPRASLEAVPAWIMYMPAGTHTIHATQGGVPVERTVVVDRETAQRLAASLEAWRAMGKRPYVDLDHDHGGAAGWVEAFEWREEPRPGVYVKLDWSVRGLEAVAGRVYRYFSPSFYADDQEPARVIGAPLVMGGLVNDPAFESIAPIWSKMNTANQAPPAQDAHQELAAARAKLAELEEARAALEADKRSTAEQLSAAQAAVEAAQKRIQELEAEIRAQREARAEAAVQAAIERGALPPAATELHAKWRRALLQDPTALELLEKLPPVRPEGTGRVQVIREDTATVLKAYEGARNPLERGRIYVREIRPRIERGETLPLEAANTLGTLAGTLVVQRSLDLLKERYPLLGRISTDFSDEPVAYNQTVVTRTRTVPTAADYNPATGYATQDAQATDVSVTINIHKAVQVRFSANELAGTSRRLLDEWTEPIHAGLAKAIMDSVYALITAANYPNATTQAVAGFSRATVVKMARNLNARGVSTLNRTLLLNPDYFEKLAQDSTIVQLAAYQRAEYITEYRLPRVAGFDPYEAPSLPGTGNLTGAGFAPDAIVLATRPPNDYTQAVAGVSTGVVQTVVNPDTGMAVMLTTYVDHNLGAAVLRVALMWGVAKGQAASLERLVSA